MRNPIRRLRNLCFGIIVGFAVGISLGVVAPAAVGWRTLTVMSGSMTPAIRTGDAVVSRPVRPEAIAPGDVVTFRDPEGTDRLITHRVRSAWVEGANVQVVTKGDANSSSEQWQVPRGGSVGRVVYRLPRVGYVLVPAASPVGRLLLVATPMVILGVLGLLAIWRPRPKAVPPVVPAPVVVPDLSPPVLVPTGARPTVFLAHAAFPTGLTRPSKPPVAALPPGPSCCALHDDARNQDHGQP